MPFVTLWRIASGTVSHAPDDVSGRGAERTGGRWNRRGTPLVYASASRALAYLETVVQLGADDLPVNRYLVEIRVTDAAWTKRVVFDAASHEGWDAEPAGEQSVDWGAAWVASNAALIAEVPSVIVPEESNVLLNPRHPSAPTVNARTVRPWTYDRRLRRRLLPSAGE